MPSPYSDDLRKKVIEAIEIKKIKKTQVSKIFNISRNTIDLWLKKKVNTGNILPKLRSQKGINRKIKDWNQFEKFVENHQDKTQQEMAVEWERHSGGKISYRTIGRALKKLNFTRKKRTMVIENGMK